MSPPEGAAAEGGSTAWGIVSARAASLSSIVPLVRVKMSFASSVSGCASAPRLLDAFLRREAKCPMPTCFRECVAAPGEDPRPTSRAAAIASSKCLRADIVCNSWSLVARLTVMQPIACSVAITAEGSLQWATTLPQRKTTSAD